MLIKKKKSVLAIFSREHLVAFAAENHVDGTSNIFFVIDNEYGFFVQ